MGGGGGVRERERDLWATKRDNVLRFFDRVVEKKKVTTKSWERKKINPSHASTLRGTHRFLSVFSLVVSAWKLCVRFR